MESLTQSIQNIREINNKQNDSTAREQVEQYLQQIERLMRVSHKGTILLIKMPRVVHDAMDPSFTSKHCRVISEGTEEIDIE